MYPSALFLSALKRKGIDVLLSEICRMLEKREVEEEFFVELDHMHVLEKFREKVTIKKSVITDRGLIVRVKARESVLKKLAILLNGGMKTCES